MNEDIFLTKINAFKKKAFETNEVGNSDALSDNLDNIVASIPVSDEETYFKLLHVFFMQMADERLFDKPDFVNNVFRKLLNLYAYYLDNDSVAVCAVFISGILGNKVFCGVNDIQNLLNYMRQANIVLLPSFPILENDECCDNLHEIFVRTKKLIDENPYIIFYSVDKLRERLGECVAATVDNYENIQIIMHDDSLGFGALLLLSLLPDDVLDSGRVICVVPEGSLAKCRHWLAVPSNRVWLDKKAKYHHETKKTMKCIKEKDSKKSSALFHFLAGGYRKTPILPDSPDIKPTGFFILADCFEPKLPDCSLCNAAWAAWDNPIFLRLKGSDRFLALGCALFKDDAEAMPLIEFYKSLRGIKNEREVLKLWENTAVQEPRTHSEFLIKADILCRAGEFEKSFELLKTYYEAKVSAAYRICNSILHHCNQPQLRARVSRFIEEKELFQKAFCAELHEAADEAEDDEKSRWL